MERIETVLVGSKLYFTPPSSFNDPLDCRVPLSFDASPLKMEHHWRKFVKEQFPGESVQRHKKRIRELMKLSRTAEGVRELNEQMFRELDSCGMLSLSRHEDNMLMWSYYAEGHKGIALRFNMAPEQLMRIPVEFFPLEVKYSADLPHINYYDLTRADRTHLILGTKAIAWAHEAEWRLVLVNRTGNVQVPPELIDGVILGWRIERGREATIRSWIKQRGTRTEILRIRHRPGSFELEAVPA